MFTYKFSKLLYKMSDHRMNVHEKKKISYKTAAEYGFHQKKPQWDCAKNCDWSSKKLTDTAIIL